MGLDITAVSKATLIKPDATADEYEGMWCATDCPPIEWISGRTDFPEHMTDVKHGIYRIDGEHHGFGAGSYPGYNAWRRWLAMNARGRTPETFWGEHGDDSGPFGKLINFSDCEGVIGPSLSAELLKDFQSHDPTNWHKEVYGWHQQDLVDVYEHFRRAFELAADSGFVIFH